MRQLLEGPQGAELEGSARDVLRHPRGNPARWTSTIDDGIATVDLSDEFSDAGGGTRRATPGPAAQVVYTLTQFSTVRSVRIQLDGGRSSPSAPRASTRA